MNRDRKPYTMLVTAALALGLALAGCATPNTQPAADQQVSAAQATLRDFERDPDMTWFRDNLKNARAVIISPRVTRAAFVFGGSGGEAVVLSRDGKGERWAGPAFYKVGAGASSTVTTDLVSFARTKGAYAGVSLEGAVIRPDAEANTVFYGRNVSPVDILVRGAVNNPAAAPLQQSLRAAAR
jgi:lipid-binding SYLF domain-containing protein